MEDKYEFKQLKSGDVSVYNHGIISAIISDDVAKERGYKNAMEYCKKVFEEADIRKINDYYASLEDK